MAACLLAFYVCIVICCVRYMPMVLQVFELPTVLAYPLFYKLVAPESSVVRKDAILQWMSSKQVRSLLCSADAVRYARVSWHALASGRQCCRGLTHPQAPPAHGRAWSERLVRVYHP